MFIFRIGWPLMEIAGSSPFSILSIRLATSTSLVELPAANKGESTSKNTPTVAIRVAERSSNKHDEAAFRVSAALAAADAGPAWNLLVIADLANVDSSSDCR